MYAILADERTRDWFRVTAASMLTILALSGSLPAQTPTSWRTTAGSGAWGTSDNWTAGTPSATTTAEFSTSNFTSIDLGTTNRHARGLYFHPGANGFTFGGTHALYLYSDGVVVDGGSQAINSWRVAMRANGEIPFTNNGTGPLRFTGEQFGPWRDYNVTAVFGGSGDIEVAAFGRRDDPANLDLVKTGTGTLTVTGHPNLATPVDWERSLGSTTVHNGELVINDVHDSAITIPEGNLYVAPGAGDSAKITHTAGTVNGTTSRRVIVGQAGAGEYEMTGGTLNAGDRLTLAHAGSGSSGVFQMTGGTLNVRRLLNIGREGTGAFVQDGADTIVNVGESSDPYFWIGGNNSSYTLKVGELRVGSYMRGTDTNPRFYFEGGTLRPWGSNLEIRDSLPVTLTGSNGVLNTTDRNGTARTVTIRSAIDESGGSFGFTKAGEGTVILAGANTYTGGTTLSAGTLRIGDGGTSGAIVGNVLNNAILEFSRSDTTTFAGEVSGVGSLVKSGAGHLTLTGNSDYTGGTTLLAGVLEAASNSALGTGTVGANGGGLSVSHGVDVDNDVEISAGTLVITTGGLPVEYLVVAAGGGGGYGRGGGGGAGGVLTGAGVLVGNDYAVSVGAGGAGGISGNEQGGDGGDSHFAGFTADGGGGGGGGGSPTSPGIDGRDGASGGGGGGVTSGTAGAGGSGTSPQGNHGGAGQSGGDQQAGGGGGAGEPGQAGSDGGSGGDGITVGLGGTQFSVGGGGGGGSNVEALQYASQGGAGGGGRGGGTGVGEPGDDNTGGGGGGGGSRHGFHNGGAGGSGVVAIAYLGPALATGGTISGSSGYTVHTFTGVGADTFSFDAAGVTATLSGDIFGSGGLTFDGPGTLVLAGANSYTGPTNISAGTLKLGATGSIADSSAIHIGAGAYFDVADVTGGFAVASGQTLSGTGTVRGNTTIAGGGIVATGTSVGTLTFENSLTFQDGAVWNWEFINTDSGKYDQVVGPELVLPSEGAVTLNIMGLMDHEQFSISLYDEFTIFTGDVLNFDVNRFVLNDVDSGWSRGWKVSVGNSLLLTAVPEPGTWMLAIVAMVCGLLVRRRGKR